MRKNRNLAGFAEVANQNVNDSNNDNVNDNVNININKLVNIEKEKKQLIGIYFDPDVAKVINDIKQKGGRGVQSKIVNEAVKKLFQENGLM